MTRWGWHIIWSVWTLENQMLALSCTVTRDPWKTFISGIKLFQTMEGSEAGTWRRKWISRTSVLQNLVVAKLLLVWKFSLCNPDLGNHLNLLHSTDSSAFSSNVLTMGTTACKNPDVVQKLPGTRDLQHPLPKLSIPVREGRVKAKDTKEETWDYLQITQHSGEVSID